MPSNVLDPEAARVAANSGKVTNPALAYLSSLSSVRSRRTMHSRLTIIARHLGAQNIYDCHWASLRHHHVQEIVEWLHAEGRAPATINTYLAALKGVTMEAWMMGLVDTDSYIHIRHIGSIGNHRPPAGRVLSFAESDALLRCCLADRSIAGLRDTAIVALMLGCGLRRSEVVSLNIDSIDWNEGRIMILGKGEKERLVFMPVQTEQHLRHWVEQTRGVDPGPLFTRIRRHEDNTGERLSDQAIYYILKARQNEAKLENFAPHDLRRTYATRLLNNGENLSTVKELLGHASVNTTEKLERREQARLKRASQLLRI